MRIRVEVDVHFDLRSFGGFQVGSFCIERGLHLSFTTS